MPGKDLISDAKGKFTYPDGKSEEFTTKAGDATYSPALTHLPENTGKTPLDLILVELKGKNPAKPMTAKAPKK